VAINPKSKVPALKRDDGSVLTDIRRSRSTRAEPSEKHLVPPGSRTGACARSHGLCHRHAARFVAHVLAARQYHRQRGRTSRAQERGTKPYEGLSLIDRELAGKDYLLGALLIADAALYFRILGH